MNLTKCVEKLKSNLRGGHMQASKIQLAMKSDFIIMKHRQEIDKATVSCGGEMERHRKSYPENQKDVYKFWLGFLEKETIVLGTVVIVPRLIGQLKYSVAILIWVSVIILLLLGTMNFLSRKLWYLSKSEKPQYGEQPWPMKLLS